MAAFCTIVTRRMNVFIRRYFLKSSLYVNLRSFMIEQYAPLLSLFLIQGCTYCLRFLLCFIRSWLSNKLPPAITNKSISLLLSMSATFLTATFLF